MGKKEIAIRFFFVGGDRFGVLSRAEKS